MDILFKFEPPPSQLPLSAIPMIYPVYPHDSYFVGKVYIFGLPLDNSVGSLSIDYSSLTAITFGEGDHLKFRRIKRKRDIEIMGNGFTILPNKKMVGWNQGRGFQLIDISNKKLTYWSICGDMEDNIETINCLDEDKKIFAFEVRTSNRRGFDVPFSLKYTPDQWYVFLKVVDLSGKTVNLLSEKIIDIADNDGLWTVHNKSIYYFSDKARRFLAFDSNLKSINPPFVDAYNKLGMLKTYMTSLLFHPTLPFAIFRIFVQGNDSSLIPESWISIFEKDSCKILPLFLGKESIHCKKFTFSPDGNWLIFTYTSEYEAPPHYYYMKVSPKNPMFLESPQYLGNIFAKTGGKGITTAWSTKPTSFAVCDGKAIYKWNMEKVTAGKKQDNN